MKESKNHKSSLVINPWNLSTTKVIHEKYTHRKLRKKNMSEMRSSRTEEEPEKTKRQSPLKENSKGTYVRSGEEGRSIARQYHTQVPLDRQACIPACTRTWRCSGNAEFRWRSSSRRSGWGQGGRTPGLGKENGSRKIYHRGLWTKYSIVQYSTACYSILQYGLV